MPTKSKKTPTYQHEPAKPLYFRTLIIITHIIISVMFPLHKSPYTYSNIDLNLNS